mgnify:CR=1 FL=1
MLKQIGHGERKMNLSLRNLFTIFNISHKNKRMLRGKSVNGVSEAVQMIQLRSKIGWRSDFKTACY